MKIHDWTERCNRRSPFIPTALSVSFLQRFSVATRCARPMRQYGKGFQFLITPPFHRLLRHLCKSAKLDENGTREPQTELKRNGSESLNQRGKDFPRVAVATAECARVHSRGRLSVKVSLTVDRNCAPCFRRSTTDVPCRRAFLSIAECTYLHDISISAQFLKSLVTL